jgi:DNA processing protein
MTIFDPDYPQRLRNIFDPPLVLYVRGKLPDLNKLPCITVVGPREASPYGMDVARQIGWQLSSAGTVVVSGMARGIDSAAHRGALLGGTPTVAVFGTAIDICYPKENVQLMRDILQNGCLISEYPPGAPANRSNFPRRNRIMSGLSLGTVVADAPVKSGSLITAEFAAEQGRDVFAVPGNILSKGSAGVHRLLKEGAKAVTHAGDILEEYEPVYGAYLQQPQIELVPLPPEVKPATTRKKAEAPVKTSPPARQPEPTVTVEAPPEELSLLSAEAKRLYDVLSEQPQPVDELSAKAGMTARQTLASVTELEMLGLIRSLPGKQYALKTKGTR